MRRSAFAIALCLTGWIAVSYSAAQPVTIPCPQPGPSWDKPPSGLPVDVCYPDTQRSDFNALSWQIFKFLVWPASPASSKQRGEADTSRKITDMRGPRTFETLKADWETFLPNAVDPSPWEAYPRVALPCTNQPNIKPGDLVLASFSEFGNLREVDNTPGLTNLLVAQNWTYVRYLAAYNKEVFNTIVSNKLYNAAIVHGIARPVPGSPVPDAAIEPNGAMTVKSAWIELPKGNDPSGKHLDPSRFYVRRDAWLQDPQTRVCSPATVGLVGLHIVFKTQSRPQWIWSTFEHMDNVPEQDDHSGKTYTFNNGDGTHMTDDPEPMYLFPPPPKPGVPPKPFQVERLQKISDDTLKANGRSQAELGKLGSVWRYYKLVMTQWPFIPFAPKDDATQAGPIPKCSERGANAAINTTMETFLQTKQCDPRDPPKLTCMGCHNKARATDFIWSIPMNAKFPTDSQPFHTPRDDALKALQDILQGSQP